MKHTSKKISFVASKSAGEVGGLFIRPDKADFLLVFAHGAGAGMLHRFMEAAAQGLADNGIATLRYQFPYMEKGSGRPDPKPILYSTVRAAIAKAHELAPDLPLIAGGKSMGGRMTSMAASEEPLDGVHGIVFFGFPLHPPGRNTTERSEHLFQVTIPMLFLQGTRDTLADLSLLKPVCRKLEEKATLHVVEGADHSFHMLKSSGRTDAEVLAELCVKTKEWTTKPIKVTVTRSWP